MLSARLFDVEPWLSFARKSFWDPSLNGAKSVPYLVPSSYKFALSIVLYAIMLYHNDLFHIDLVFKNSLCIDISYEIAFVNQ